MQQRKGRSVKGWEAIGCDQPRREGGETVDVMISAGRASELKMKWTDRRNSILEKQKVQWGRGSSLKLDMFLIPWLGWGSWAGIVGGQSPTSSR